MTRVIDLLSHDTKREQVALLAYIMRVKRSTTGTISRPRKTCAYITILSKVVGTLPVM